MAVGYLYMYMYFLFAIRARDSRNGLLGCRSCNQEERFQDFSFYLVLLCECEASSIARLERFGTIPRSVSAVPGHLVLCKPVSACKTESVLGSENTTLKVRVIPWENTVTVATLSGFSISY